MGRVRGIVLKVTAHTHARARSTTSSGWLVLDDVTDALRNKRRKKKKKKQKEEMVDRSWKKVPVSTDDDDDDKKKEKKKKMVLIEIPDVDRMFSDQFE